MNYDKYDLPELPVFFFDIVRYLDNMINSSKFI